MASRLGKELNSVFGKRAADQGIGEMTADDKFRQAQAMEDMAPRAPQAAPTMQQAGDNTEMALRALAQSKAPVDPELTDNTEEIQQAAQLSAEPVAQEAQTISPVAAPLMQKALMQRADAGAQRPKPGRIW